MDPKKGTDYRALERMIKGFANHRRIEMLELLERKPELSVLDITEELHIGYQNASDHVRKMAIAGLVMKRNAGSAVLHRLTPRAQAVLSFCRSLS